MRDLRIRKLCLNICVGSKTTKLILLDSLLQEKENGRGQERQVQEPDEGPEDQKVVPQHLRGRVWWQTDPCRQGAGVPHWTEPRLLQGPLHCQVLRYPSYEKISVHCTVRGPKAEEILE